MIGLEGPTRMAKMDTFRFRGKHWEDLGYRSEFYGTHQPCPHSGWAWKGHVGAKKSNKNIGKLNEKPNIPASSGTKHHFFQKSTKTKMTALARSIGLQGGWNDFNQNKSMKIAELCKQKPFYHSPSSDNLYQCTMLATRCILCQKASP